MGTCIHCGERTERYIFGTGQNQDGQMVKPLKLVSAVDYMYQSVLWRQYQ